MYIHPNSKIQKFIRQSADVGNETITLWTPTSGARINIFDIVVSCSSAATVTVFADTNTAANRIFLGYFAANQGASINFTGNVVLDANSVVKVTSTAATASITIVGMEV